MKSLQATSSAQPPACVRQLTDYDEATPAFAEATARQRRKTVKKLVLFIIAVLLVAVPAFAGSIYKTEPSTDVEKAAGKVLEALHERRKANDARGASELYAEKAVYKFHWGSQSELYVKEGRMSIYIALSTATIQGAELSDIVVKMVDDKTVEATGRMSIKISAFAAKFLKEPEVKWKLCLADKWQICYEEHSQAPAVRQ